MSFDTRVEAHHQLGLSNAVQLALQQMGSKLRPFITEKPASGEAIPATDLIEAVVAQRGNGRRRSNIENPVARSRRWLVYREPIETGQYLDKEDKFRSAMDPTSEIVQAHTSAMGRGIDDLILGIDNVGAVTEGGIFGAVGEGKRNTATSTLPAANITVHGGTGLTLAKLRKARKTLALGEVDMDRTRLVMAITASQADDLLGVVEATSSSLNAFDQAQLVDGKVSRLLGFDFVHINRLPLSGTTRSCPVWVPDMIKLGVWQDVQSNIWNDTAARNTPYMHIDAYMDCARAQDGGVHVIECTEA